MNDYDTEEIKNLVREAKYAIKQAVEEEIETIIYKAYVTGKEAK